MIELKLNVNEVNYVLQAIAQRPIAEALEVFNKIKSQADAQVSEKKDA